MPEMITNEVRQAAESLVASLEEAIAVSDAGKRCADAAKKRVEVIRQRFRERADAWRSGQASSHLGPILESLRGGFPDPREAIRESPRLAMRHAAAFCDAYDARMRLYACPEARAGARRMRSVKTWSGLASWKS